MLMPLQKYGVLQVLLLLTIIEGKVLNYLYFRVIYGKLLQIYKRTNNIINSRATDIVALDYNRNLQGSMCCYSLTTGRVLIRV